MKTEFTKDQERIARIAKALGHPTRVAIMYFLSHSRQCCFGAIHEIFNLSKPTVSQHLKELKEAGLIEGEIEYPKVRYSINIESWREAKKLFATFFDICQCGCSDDCHCKDNKQDNYLKKDN